MKRIIAVILVLSTILSLSGCSISFDKDAAVDYVKGEISDAVDDALKDAEKQASEAIDNAIEDAKEDLTNKVEDAKEDLSNSLNGTSNKQDDVLPNHGEDETVISTDAADFVFSFIIPSPPACGR